VINEPGPADLAERVDALREAALDGRAIPAGRLYGLPELPGDGCWVDMAGVAALTGAPAKTIASWLSRRGPLRNPFPVPCRVLYRLYWPKSEIESWLHHERLQDD
jgi:predicted DNA-binding transcriptional regulator AlpA